MWRIKKPETLLGGEPKRKNAQANPPQMGAPGFAEGTTKMNKNFIRPAEATNDRATTRLGPSLHVKGAIHGNEDMYIDGEIEGLVHLDEGNLTVGRTAKLTANITAGQVVVHGIVNGNIRANNRIEIKKEGSVTGDLTTPQILIEDGAYFKGTIEINGGIEKKAGDAPSPSTATKSAAAGATSAS